MSGRLWLGFAVGLSSTLGATARAADEPARIEVLDPGASPRRVIAMRLPEDGARELPLMYEQRLPSLGEEGYREVWPRGAEALALSMIVGHTVQGRDAFGWPVVARVIWQDGDREVTRMLGHLAGMAVTFRLDPRGDAALGEMTLRGEPLPAQLLPEPLAEALGATTRSRFPEEPVGEGAIWRITTPSGVSRVTLAQLADDTVTLATEATTMSRTGEETVEVTSRGRVEVSLTSLAVRGSWRTGAPTREGVLPMILEVAPVETEHVPYARTPRWVDGVPDGLRCPRGNRARVLSSRFASEPGVEGSPVGSGPGWRCESEVGVADGPIVVWTPQGHRAVTGGYRDDVRHGVWRTFISGLPFAEVTYRDGVVVRERRFLPGGGWPPRVAYVVPDDAPVSSAGLRLPADWSAWDWPPPEGTIEVFDQGALLSRPRHGPWEPLPDPAARIVSTDTTLEVRYANGARDRLTWDPDTEWGHWAFFDPQDRLRRRASAWRVLRHGEEVRLDADGAPIGTRTFRWGLPDGAPRDAPRTGGSERVVEGLAEGMDVAPSELERDRAALLARDMPDGPPATPRPVAPAHRAEPPVAPVVAPPASEVHPFTLARQLWDMPFATGSVDEADRLHGEATFWYPSGRRLARGRFLRGQYDGPWAVWRDDHANALVLQATFDNGTPVGGWTYHRPDGSLVMERRFGASGDASPDRVAKVVTPRIGDRALREPWGLEAVLDGNPLRDLMDPGWGTILRTREYFDDGAMARDEVPGERVFVALPEDIGAVVGDLEPVVDSPEWRFVVRVDGRPRFVSIVGPRRYASDLKFEGPMVALDRRGREQHWFPLVRGIPHGPYRLPGPDGTVRTGSFSVGVATEGSDCDDVLVLNLFDEDLTPGSLTVGCGDPPGIDEGYRFREDGIWFGDPAWDAGWLGRYSDAQASEAEMGRWELLNGNAALAIRGARQAGGDITEIGGSYFAAESDDARRPATLSVVLWETTYPDGQRRSEVVGRGPQLSWRTWYPDGQLREEGAGRVVGRNDAEFFGQVTGYRPDGRTWWSRRVIEGVVSRGETRTQWSVWGPTGTLRWAVSEEGVARYAPDGGLELWIPRPEDPRAPAWDEPILDQAGEHWMEPITRREISGYAWRGSDGTRREALQDQEVTVARNGVPFLETVLGDRDGARRFVKYLHEDGTLRLLVGEARTSVWNGARSQGLQVWDEGGEPVGLVGLPREAPESAVIRTRVPEWIESTTCPLPHPLDVLLLEGDGPVPAWPIGLADD